VSTSLITKLSSSHQQFQASSGKRVESEQGLSDPEKIGSKERRPPSRSRHKTGQSGKKRASPKKVYVVGTAKSPSQASAEIAILAVLSRSPVRGLGTSEVLKELKGGEWFNELDQTDLSAIYPSSRKNVVDSALKFSKKNLCLKGQVSPAGSPDTPTGIWRITSKGVERLERDRNRWIPRYVTHHSVLVEES
jgi:hypothetical protein